VSPKKAQELDLNFEEALQKLEAIIDQMEKGELSLEKSLQHLEKGLELARYCRKLLTKAEYRVEMLLKNGELVEFEKFEGD
jgi:exodeoxyribonuclease VII small subunit